VMRAAHVDLGKGGILINLIHVRFVRKRPNGWATSRRRFEPSNEPALAGGRCARGEAGGEVANNQLIEKH